MMRFTVLFLMCVLTFSSLGKADEAISENIFTMKQALIHVYETNPVLLSSRVELQAVHENMSQAKSFWKPTVSAVVDIVSNASNPDAFGSATGETETMSLDVVQPLYRGGRTVADIKAVKNEIKAQEMALLATEQDVLYQAVVAYMNVVNNKQIVALKQHNEKVLTHRLEVTQDRFDLGDVTLTDVRQAEARLSESQATLIEAKSDFKISQAKYKQIMGLKPSNMLEETPSLPIIPDSFENMSKIAEQNNPSILQAEFVEQKTFHSIKTARGELFPSISMLGNVKRTINPTFGTEDRQDNARIGVQATIPIYTAGKNYSKLRQAKYVQNQKKIDILTAQRSVKQQSLAAWEELKSTKAMIRARKAQVNANDLALEGVKEEMTLGGRTTLDLLDAEQELLDAKVNLVRAEHDKVIAVYDVLLSMGRLTAKNLGLDMALIKAENKVN